MSTSFLHSVYFFIVIIIVIRYGYVMKLLDYLKKHKKTQRQFAKETGISEAAISFYCRGRIPIREHVTTIYVHTGGKVDANSFYEF